MAAESTSRNTVTVACKLPHGLTIGLHAEGLNDEGKKVFLPTGSTVTLKGANTSKIVGGFGLTEVETDFWKAWLEQNPNFPAVKNGLLYAETRRDRAADRALDQAEARTGVEPIDPNKPGKGLDPVPEKELKAARAMGE